MSQHHHHPADRPKKKFHQDWRFILAVVLMLLAMIAYVLTQNETMFPRTVPASPPAAAPANP